MDYDELLKGFEDDSQNDKKSASSEESAKAKDAIEQAANERRKRVESFKVDIDARKEKSHQHSGVYFANNPKEIADTEAKHRKNAEEKKSPENASQERKSNLKVTVPPATEKQKMAIASKKAKASSSNKSEASQSKKEKRIERLKHLGIYAAIVAVVSLVLCIYGISCINDVLAIGRPKKAVDITVSAGMSDGEVIELLKDNGLIKNELFCKIFVKILDKGGDYVSGAHGLTSDMGVEKMLSTMKEDYTLSETVTLTFPEGYNVEQIAEKLENNKVCKASTFITTLQTVDFSSEYSFVTGITDKELRFRILEGYLYPDTYEFYIGESASSVARKFLDNFKQKWTDEYFDLAKKRNMTLDEVVTLASIVQKEAANTAEMPTISSIFINRLLKPDTFPWLQSDVTEDYLVKVIKPTLTASLEDSEKYISYRDNYDTYSKECIGLPIGPICNPGDSAINSVLNASDTNYYYFIHDDNDKLYTAATFAEHEQNIATAEEVNEAR